MPCDFSWWVCETEIGIITGKMEGFRCCLFAVGVQSVGIDPGPSFRCCTGRLGFEVCCNDCAPIARSCIEQIDYQAHLSKTLIESF